MKTVSLLILASMIVWMASSRTARAELIFEHFNYAQSGCDQPIGGRGGGSGFAVAWSTGNTSRIYECENMTLNQAGYSNLGNDLSGGRYGGTGFGTDPSREFSVQRAGTSWLSFLASRSPGNGPSLFVGSGQDAPGQQAIELGFAGASTSPPNTCAFFPQSGTGHLCSGAIPDFSRPVHLVLGKLEFDHSSGVQERVSVWINPTNLLGGEAGLGAPQLVIDGYNADSSWRKLLLSAPRGSHIDALRVGDALADVLSGAEGACLIAAGTGVQCQILGGASQPGGVSAEVDATTDGWFGGQLCETDDLALCLIDPSGLTFITPTAPAFFWNLDFSGEFSSIAVTFGYSDEGLMPVQEQLLAIFHFVSPFPGCIPGVNCEWIALPTVRDPIANTLEIVATDLSPHAIGLLPAIPVFPTSD